MNYDIDILLKCYEVDDEYKFETALEDLKHEIFYEYNASTSKIIFIDFLDQCYDGEDKSYDIKIRINLEVEENIEDIDLLGDFVITLCIDILDDSPEIITIEEYK